MTSNEMHILFRELAQKMGMQTVRLILPEQIDLCLNSATYDLIKEVVASIIADKSVNGLGGSIISRQTLLYNTKIGQLNALSTLFKKVVIDEIITENGLYQGCLNMENVLYVVSCGIYYENDNFCYDARIIPLEILSHTLRDFCNKPDRDYPISTFITNESNNDITVYNNSVEEVSKMEILVIKTPATIDNVSDEKVSCDLPLSLHHDVVKTAVGIYMNSIKGNKIEE